MYTGDLITGFNRQQVAENLASFLNKDSATVNKELFTGAPVCIKEVESEDEANEWRREFADRGAALIVLPGDEETPFGSRYAGADPANVNVAEPTIASVFSRIPAVRRRNQAFLILGMTTLLAVVVLTLLLAIVF